MTGHSDAVYKTLWSNPAKGYSEFFTGILIKFEEKRCNSQSRKKAKASIIFFLGSADGRVMWWDIKNLSRPTRVLYVRDQPVVTDLGSTALQRKQSLVPKPCTPRQDAETAAVAGPSEEHVTD